MRYAIALILCATLLGGCPGPSPTPDLPVSDLARLPDLATAPDLARPADLSIPDLARPPDFTVPPDLFACAAPSPVGCKQAGCPKGKVCDPGVGCRPSQCACDPKRRQWICTEDCGGGTCVDPSDGGAACAGPNPAGCKQTGCPIGEKCDPTVGCKPSQCICANGAWGCTKDCGGGTCVPAANCPLPNPAGCKQTGCPMGQKCDPTVGCKPSQCICANGVWGCTKDCGGGTCVPAANCPGPNPVGCKQTGCPMGEKCDPTVGCKPSACGCDAQSGQWFCTADCNGGTCV